MSFKAINTLRSSMYLRLREFILGMAGLSKAPLKMIINKRIPRKAPWGEEPGSNLLVEVDPLYLMNIDLFVR